MNAKRAYLKHTKTANTYDKRRNMAYAQEIICESWPATRKQQAQPELKETLPRCPGVVRPFHHSRPEPPFLIKIVFFNAGHIFQMLQPVQIEHLFDLYAR
jgi:hypothetical protein